MPHGTVFRTNRSQAVRLPKAAAFPDSVTRVKVEIVGQARLLAPVVTSWREWEQSRSQADPTFLEDRGQGQADQRDWGES